MSLDVRHLSFSYGNHTVLKDVSFEVPDGSLTCVLGPNGTGKTTLFRCILGLNQGYGGTVAVNGTDASKLSVRKRALEIAYIPQSHRSVFDYEALDVVLMACGGELSVLKSPGKEQVEHALVSLERVGIVDLAHRPVTELSGGQQQLVLVARAVAQNSHTIVMDEPTSALDFANTSRILNLVRSLADEGRSVLLSTHHPDQAYLYSDAVLALEEGRVVVDGTPQSVVTSEHISRLYHIGVRVSSLYDDHVRVCVPESSIQNLTQDFLRQGENGASRHLNV